MRNGPRRSFSSDGSTISFTDDDRHGPGIHRRNGLATGAWRVITGLGVWWFGNSSGDLWRISVAAAITGGFVNSGISGIYAILAQVFPSAVRATGTGFTVGIGRAGAIASPIIAGLFLDEGWALGRVAMLMGLGPLGGALALLKLAVPDARRK